MGRRPQGGGHSVCGGGDASSAEGGKEGEGVGREVVLGEANDGGAIADLVLVADLVEGPEGIGGAAALGVEVDEGAAGEGEAVEGKLEGEAVEL